MMKERKWRKFLRDIQENRCILMLGSGLSGLSVDGKWKSLTAAFSEYLAEQLEEEEIAYEKSQKNNLPYIAQLFLTIEDVRRIDLEDEAKDFLKRHTKNIPPIYHLLAKLPFNLIVNTTFDNYLERAFNQAGKFSKSYYYNYKRKGLEEIDPKSISDKTPLIYNLFGSIEKTESLVLADEDQVEFVRNVVREDPGVPEQIMEQFDHSKTYLFLGFNVDHWQFRLLLESLKLKDGNSTHAPNTGIPISATTKNLFKKRYKFQFIEDGIDDFLVEMGKRYTVFTEDDPSDEKRNSKKVFIAYDDRDKAILDKVETFAHPLVDRKELTILHKEKIPFGQEEEEAVRTFMEEADTILLLLSADFLSDATIKERELAWAFEIQAQKNTQIIPVIGRTCAWDVDARINKLVALPSNGTPLVHNSWASPDDAYSKFVEELKKRIW